MLQFKFTERLIQREVFNPCSKDHLLSYSNYLTSGSWAGNCPFLLEWPFNDIPTMISNKILDAHLQSIITKVKDKQNFTLAEIQMACGRHIILECYDCDDELLKQEKMLEQQLIHSAEFARATVLHSYFHKFGEGGDVTGVIALAESHISVHTWPEYGYMAVDIFMCGECNPMDSVDYIISNLDIGQFEYQEIQRGDQFQFSRTVTYAAE